MSLTGSIVIIVVLLARIVMKKLPKKYMYILWGIVGFRLLCPIAFESRFSIFNIKPIRNSVENVRQLPLIQYGSGYTKETAGTVTHTVKTAADTAQTHISVAPFILISVWAAIAVGIICYIVYKYVTIKHDLKNTTEVKPGLYVGHQVDSPFVMGIVKPRIYMPAGLTENELEYLTLHEKTHIRRGDTFFKALGILILAIHWFNPLVWLAYAMFVRDMEMSCDEEVIAKLGNDVKADYSMSLVSFARRSNRSKYIVVPIAFSKALFGRKDVKMRIKNVLGYHGTSKLISTLALVLVASISLVCLFNATSRADEEEGGVEIDAPDDSDAVEVIDVDGDNSAAEDGSDVVEDIDVDGGDSDEVITEEPVVDPGDDANGYEVLVPEEATDSEQAPEEYVVNVPDEAVTDEEKAAVAANSPAVFSDDTENIFNERLPIFTGVNTKVVLNLKKGTKVEDHPELDGYLIPGMPLESDAFCVYYSQSVSKEAFMEFVEALKVKYGFTKDAEFIGSGLTFSATNSSNGLSVTVEILGDDYMRVSYYKLVDGVNTFSRLG